MAKRGWYIAGGVGAFLLLGWIFNWAVPLLILAAVIGIPVAAYFMLDPSQRRRLKRIRERRQLGR